VTDKDTGDAPPETPSINTFSWDVYHIENYFVNPKYVTEVLAALSVNNPPSEEAVTDELRECARETMPQLLRHELAEYANSALIKAINTGTDPSKGDLVAELSEAVQRSVARVTKASTVDVGESGIRTREAQLRSKYEKSLADGTWVSVFRGRDVLKRFAGRRAQSVSYEMFRNLIVSRMRDDGFQPPGMKTVINAILKD
jgi:hypothetical protein